MITRTLTSLTLFALVSLLVPNVADAASKSPTGYWKTVDDETGDPRSVVKLSLRDGKIYGKIVQLFRNQSEKDDPDPFCTECQGALSKQKVVGLEILKDLAKDGDEWGDGEILDPANGKYYSCFIEVQNNGMQLKVRGYMGISLLGRTQHWYRVPKPDLTIRTFLLGKDGSLEALVFEEGHGPIKEVPAAAPTPTTTTEQPAPTEAPAEPAKTK